MDIDFDENPGNEKDFTFALIKDEASRIDICLCTGKETLMELCINDSRFVCPKCNSISKIENYSYIDQSNIKIKADNYCCRLWCLHNTTQSSSTLSYPQRMAIVDESIPLCDFSKSYHSHQCR